MEIKFKLIDEKHIKIINEKGEDIGQIFCPAGSGELYNNAIQICGFEDAYDLWGCACYERPSFDEQRITYKTDKNGKKIYEQVKDIQLRFSEESRRGYTSENLSHCYRCYNDPCTCEVKIKTENTYTLKRSHDLHLTRKDGG